MSLHVDIHRDLKGFSLQLAFDKGKGRLGILGASGCGKSMTLRCIAGIDTPDRGRIESSGRVLFDSKNRINLRPQQRRIGYLFQSYALFPNMTVERNILCSAKAKDARKLDEVLGLLHLEGLKSRYPSQLSGGQQQRVALARILYYDPEVLLLDEPFAAMDAYLREELQMQLLELFSHFDKDIVLVSHNRDEVYTFCDALLVMDAGRMLKMGDTKHIFENPELLQIARLTGCKNISPAKRIGDNALYATDWGIELQTARPLSDELTHVGIRAQDLFPATGSEPNLIEVRALRRAEDPFESNVIFACKQASGEICFKFKRRPDCSLPDLLSVDPANVLPLSDKN